MTDTPTPPQPPAAPAAEAPPLPPAAPTPPTPEPSSEAVPPAPPAESPVAAPAVPASGEHVGSAEAGSVAPAPPNPPAPPVAPAPPAVVAPNPPAAPAAVVEPAPAGSEAPAAPVQGEVISEPAAPIPAPVPTPDPAPAVAVDPTPPPAPDPVPATADVVAAEVAPAPAVSATIQEAAPVVEATPVSQELAVIEQPTAVAVPEIVAPKPLPSNAGELMAAGFSEAEIREMQELAAEATEVIEQNDLRLSQFTIVQGMSRAVKERGARPGKIMHTLTGEQFDEIEFVVCFLKKTRTRFGKSIGDPPRCASPNAMDGYGDVADQLIAKGVIGPNGGGNCLRCPQAVVNFQKKIFGDCALQMNFIGFRAGDDVDVSQEMPLVVQMQRTSILTGQNTMTLIAAQTFPWAIRIKLSVKEKKNDEGEFYVWNVASAGPASPEEQRKAMETARMVRAADNLTVEQSDVGETVDLGDGPLGPTKEDDEIPF